MDDDGCVMKNGINTDEYVLMSVGCGRSVAGKKGVGKSKGTCRFLRCQTNNCGRGRERQRETERDRQTDRRKERKMGGTSERTAMHRRGRREWKEEEMYRGWKRGDVKSRKEGREGRKGVDWCFKYKGGTIVDTKKGLGR
jgi:hypothetical protein